MKTAVIKNTNYVINVNGDLLNLKTNRFKKWTKDTNGYMKTQIWTNGMPKNVHQHRLLADYFIPNIELKKQVNHINGIKNDNRLKNLEWVTQSENTLHSFANGLQKASKPNMKKVIDKVSGDLFESISEASRKSGWSVNHLRNMLLCNIKNKTNLEFYEK